MKNIYLLIIIIIIVGLNSYSQKPDLDFKHITIDDGLSQSTINCMMQDSEGFIWIGTQGGLNRYNGSSKHPFDVYLHNFIDTNSLSSSWIYAIAEDKSDNIWIATMQGLDKLNKKTGKIERFLHNSEDPQSISKGSVFGVYVDSKGDVWAKTYDALNKLDTATGKFKNFAHEIAFFKAKQNRFAYPIYEDTKGNFWVGSQDGLFLFDRDNETWKRYITDNSDIADNHVNAIFEDKKGSLWIGTENGLSKYNYKNNKFYNYQLDENNNGDGLSNNDIRAICEDHAGNIWIGTFGGGLNMFDPKTDEFRFFMPNVNDHNSISHPLILSIIEDNSHILWVGTYGGAINKIDLKSKKFNLYTQHNFGLNYNDMAAIYEEDGILWIGTWGKGLNLYNKNTGEIEYLTSKSLGKRKLLNDFIHVIKKDSRGFIWIGTRNGINIYDKSKDEFSSITSIFTKSNSSKIADVFKNKRINEIIEDKDKNMWLGTEEGLYKINMKEEKIDVFLNKASNKESLSNNHVYALLEDKDGFIWIGTVANGLNRYNPVTGVFKRYQGDVRNPNTISNNRVFDIIEDSDGFLWIATANGLNKFNKRDTSFTIYTKASNNLHNDLVYNIIEDNNKNIWITTGYGIAMFDKANNMFVSYNKSDGLGSLELNFGSLYKSKTGEIFFGGTGGLNHFYPDSIFINPFVPPVVFLDYSKYNNEGVFSYSLNGIDEIELDPSDHTLCINFASLEFTNTNKNQYKYQLKGHSDVWIDLGNRNFQTFTTLPAGEYILNVMASNNDGVWNDEVASLKIIVHAPFWQTTIAYIVYVLILLLIVILIIRARTKK